MVFLAVVALGGLAAAVLLPRSGTGAMMAAASCPHGSQLTWQMNPGHHNPQRSASNPRAQPCIPQSG
jgi:hypothetical protein